MGLSRECMSHRIRQILEERIISGTLQSGDRLLELEIAREFNTSQTPVREAFEALHTQRLVESIPYRGTYVRPITNQEMQEAYAVRGVLEQLAAELSSPLRRGNVSDLKEIQAELIQAAVAKDISAYALHNDRFHRAVVESSQNQVLVDSWRHLGFEARVRILMNKHHEPDLPARAQEHQPAIDALERGDGQAAGLCLRAHAQACSERWQARMAAAENSVSEPSDGDRVPATVLS